jgi:alpha-beta hydrolase superfamily lysophospholipase
MTILFLHGWHSVPGGVKPSYLLGHGHEVLNPALDDDDFAEAVRTAQVEHDRHHPDVIAGSSRGGAVAMNIDSGSTPLVLLCPAWKRWGTAQKVKPGTILLHSESDDVIPIADSRELLRNSGLPDSALILVGSDHRLADPEPLRAMLEACERVTGLGRSAASLATP